MKAPVALARRWAERIPQERSRAGKARCLRRCLDALYTVLPPKVDGTHPLDSKQFKLEG